MSIVVNPSFHSPLSILSVLLIANSPPETLVITNDTFHSTYPFVKLYCQFEFNKTEDVPPRAHVRDYRVTFNNTILEAFKSDLKVGNNSSNNSGGAEDRSTDADALRLLAAASRT